MVGFGEIADPCASNPCVNDAYCQDTGTAYACHCEVVGTLHSSGYIFYESYQDIDCQTGIVIPIDEFGGVAS